MKLPVDMLIFSLVKKQSTGAKISKIDICRPELKLEPVSKQTLDLQINKSITTQAGLVFHWSVQS